MKDSGFLKTLATAAILFAAAFFLRFSGTDSRPFHPDEAVNAFLLEESLGKGGYAYRPHDHHGPALFLLAAGCCRFLGVTKVAEMESWALRMIPVTCGALVALLAFLLFRKVIGEKEALAAGALTALGAPFVYYSGSFIHETPLMLLTLGFASVFWRWRETGGARKAAAGGLLGGLMLATKETGAILAPCIIFALLPGSGVKRREKIKGMTIGALTAALTVSLFFSDFLKRPEKLRDLAVAARLHFQRGTGSEHAHPWHAYAEWMGGAGGAGFAICLCFWSAIGLCKGFRHPAVRACAVWGASMAAFHCALPYKTPWLALSFLLPATLVAGYGIGQIFLQGTGPRIRFVALALTALPIFAETLVKCRLKPADPENPLAYSPGTAESSGLKKDLDAELAAPGMDQTPVRVVAGDYWPLPWELRKLPAVGFQSASGDAPVTAPSFIVCGPENLGEYATQGPFKSYAIRPGVYVFLAKIRFGCEEAK